MKCEILRLKQLGAFDNFFSVQSILKIFFCEKPCYLSKLITTNIPADIIIHISHYYH